MNSDQHGTGNENFNPEQRIDNESQSSGPPGESAVDFVHAVMPARLTKTVLPLWIIALFCLFIALRLYELAAPSGNPKHHPISEQVSGGMSDSQVQDYMTTEYEAKSAFMIAGVSGSPDTTMLTGALQSAVRLQKSAGDAPSVARRILILRFLLGKPPLAALENGSLPITAFSSAAKSTTSLTDRASYVAEGHLWTEVFGTVKPSHKRADQLAEQIRKIPSVRWWEFPALTVLYQRAGETKQSSVYSGEACDSATGTMFPLMTVLLGWYGMGICGLLILAYFAFYAFVYSKPDANSSAAGGEQLGTNRLPLTPRPPLPQRGEGEKSETVPGSYGQTFPVEGVSARVVNGALNEPRNLQQPGLRRKLAARLRPPDAWPTVPEATPLSERRLTAADLLGVFLFYLLFQDAIGFALFGVGRFHGLLAPYVNRLKLLPVSTRISWEILLEGFFYVLCAALPIFLLIRIAKRRGASLANEIGLSARRLRTNILYGLAGYCLCLPLLLLAEVAAHGAFPKAPSPTNPVIPMMAGAPPGWPQIVLFVTATIAAPIAEEIMFRGVFYNAAKLRFGVWPAIVLTGLIFGFVHPVGIAGMAPLMVLGGVFAWLAETRKSLVPGMIGHFCQNFFTSTMLFLIVSK